MKKSILHTRKARHVRLSAVLTALVILVTVLANTVFQTLADRYGWYSSMSAPTSEYPAGETSFALLDSAFASAESRGDDPSVEFIFCDVEKNVLAEETVAYLYSTVKSLQEHYPDRITVNCYDVTLNPNTVKNYLTSVDPITGEELENALATTSLIVVAKDYHRVYALDEFYAVNETDGSAWAYNGQRKLVSGIIRAITPEKPVVCLLDNHGEAYFDYELMSFLDDAGYQICTLDLQTEPLPEDCSLIVSYNPTTDLIADGVSAVSEVEILDSFLSEDGHSFLTFLGSASPKLPNFEAFLSGWGVSFGYYNDTANEATYRYTLQDTANSLTSDGYTVYGAAAEEGRAKELLEGLGSNVVFKNATVLRAAQGFVNNGDGSYQKDGRTLYSLYESNPSAASYANGAARDRGGMLMSVTEEKRATGASFVGVVASTDFVTAEFVQSAVYGNGDSLLRLCGIFGKGDVPEGLRVQPFRSYDISTVTISQKWGWTLLLVAIPTVAVTLIATIVFVKRRRT